MNNNIENMTLKERIFSSEFQSLPPHHALIPINNASLFYALCDEALSQIGRSGGNDLVVISDAETIQQLREIDNFLPNISKMIVLGLSPSHWNIPVEIHNPPPYFHNADRLFIIVSSSIAISFVGTIIKRTDTNGNGNLDGGWSYHRVYIQHLLHLFAPSLFQQFSSCKEDLDKITEITTRIMSVQTELLSGHESMVEMDKSELATVLEILKIISSKKRAHDVLYVFVEQISKVVQSDRCSIVRIWGKEDMVHVLASHDDVNLFDMAVPLSKYPEIKKALSIGDKVVINNVHNDPLMKPCLDSLIQKGINSILVIPIVLNDPEVGSLLLRAVRKEAGFTLREINFFEIVTNAAGSALERAQLFESVQQANKTLQKLAITDGLTGIYNHRYFRERLEEEILRSLRYNVPLSCVLFDIDDFKKCNDTYGHLFGDAVLKEISTRILQTIRRTDMTARYGGEEFIVIMPQTSIEGAYIQAERIRKAIEDKPFEYMGKSVNVTISGGVAEVVQNEILTVEDLLRIADQCLYQAKRKGKNMIIASKQINLP